jgi:hypothetical protein
LSREYLRDAAATTDAENEEEAGSMEAAVGLNEDVTVYQMTKKGLAEQVTLQDRARNIGRTTTLTSCRIRRGRSFSRSEEYRCDGLKPAINGH